MIDELMETFARHESLAPAPEDVRRRIDAVATRRRRLRKGLVGGTAVALVALVATVFVRVDAVRTAPDVAASAVSSAVGGPLTFLLLGIDKRPNVDDNDLRRSDTILLAHLPADRSAPYLISIPRDELVSFDGRQDTLSGVYANGGAQALRDALQEYTGIRIAGAVEVDFAGLIAVTDAVGGVDLCVHRRAVSEHTGRMFEPGCHRFSGAEAMDYLRQRRSFENGDYDRQKHGREYVTALYKRLGDASLTELFRVIKAGGNAVRVDSGGIELAALFAMARNLKADGVVSIAPPATMDGLEPEAARLWAAVRDGTLPDWVVANPQRVDQR